MRDRPEWMAENPYLKSIRYHGLPHDDMWEIADKERAGRHFDEGCKAQARKLVEYLNKDCPHRVMSGWTGEADIALRKRRECPVCIEELRQEVMGDEVGEG